MSRHRIVRRMNYEDECYDDDDDYGHSYEDSYCVSPGTAAQFTYNRERDFNLSSYMEKEIPEETDMDLEPREAQAAEPAGRTGLSDVDNAQLQSCLEELHNIMGDNIPEPVLTETVVRHNFNIESSLNELLSLKDAPKAQRTPRQRKDRSQGDDTNIEDLLSEIDALDQQENLPFVATGRARFRFQPATSPPSAISVLRKGDAGMGKKGREKSSLSFSTSPLSAKGGGPSLSELAKGSTNDKVLRGSSNAPLHSDPTSSDIDSLSSPMQNFSAAGNCLAELVQQQQKDPEPPKAGLLGHAQQQKREPVSSLSGGLNLQHKTDFPQPQAALSSSVFGKEAKRNPGLSLSEMIAVKKKQEQPAQSPGPQGTEKKTSLGLSLSEIIGAQKKQLAVPPTESSSSLSSSPQAQRPMGGLSLLELVSLHSSQKRSYSSLEGKFTAANNDSSTKNVPKPGPFLSQLVKNHSDSNCQSVPQPPAATTASQSPATGISLADLAKKHASSQSAVLAGTLGGDRREPLQAGGGGGGSLSLSALVKQHQGAGISSSAARSSSDKPPALRDINANTQNPRACSDLADSLRRGLTLKPEVELISRKDEGEAHSSEMPSQDGEGKGDVGLSLVNCLKKSLTIRTAEQKTVHPTPQSVEIEEEEDELSPESTLDLDADFSSPITVAPGMKKPPSLFARCICLHWAEGSKRKAQPMPKPTVRNAKFPRFQFQFQTRKLVKTVESPLHVVARFDFSTPSPDDVVLTRQKAAFTRTGQHTTETNS